jgi:hypothetical protein
MSTAIYTQLEVKNQEVCEDQKSYSLVYARNKSPVCLNTRFPVDTCSQTIENTISWNLKPQYIKACEKGKWTLSLTKKITGEQFYYPYKCRSWRHTGECCRYRCSQDYVRIKNAVNKLGEKWVYLVFTFDRSDSLLKSYKKIVACWDKLRKRLTRKWGKFQYIALIEQHKDRYPHVNVLIQNDALYDACKGFGYREVRAVWFDEHVEASGFGKVYWVEEMKASETIAKYFTKLVEQMSGEFAKVSQIPRSAPLHFRRLRASKGLLEKIFKSEEFTGELIFAPYEDVTFEARGGVCDVKESIKVDPLSGRYLFESH